MVNTREVIQSLEDIQMARFHLVLLATLLVLFVVAVTADDRKESRERNSKKWKNDAEPEVEKARFEKRQKTKDTEEVERYDKGKWTRQEKGKYEEIKPSKTKKATRRTSKEFVRDDREYAPRSEHWKPKKQRKQKEERVATEECWKDCPESEERGKGRAKEVAKEEEILRKKANSEEVAAKWRTKRSITSDKEDTEKESEADMEAEGEDSTQEEEVSSTGSRRLKRSYIIEDQDSTGSIRRYIVDEEVVEESDETEEAVEKTDEDKL